MIGIYKIENKINGKIYIDQSTDIETRWTEHIKEYDRIQREKDIEAYKLRHKENARKWRERKKAEKLNIMSIV